MYDSRHSGQAQGSGHRARSAYRSMPRQGPNRVATPDV